MYKMGQISLNNKTGFICLHLGIMLIDTQYVNAERVTEIAGYNLFKLEDITTDGVVTMITHEDISRLIIFKCSMDYKPKQVQYFLKQLPLIIAED